MLDLMTLYTTQRKQYVCRSDQSNHRVGNDDLSFVEDFRYQGHVMTADCQDNKNIEKQFRRQNAVGNMLVRKFAFTTMEAKICSSYIVTQFVDVLFIVILTRTLLDHLLSVRVTHSNVLLTFTDTPARVLHFR